MQQPRRIQPMMRGDVQRHGYKRKPVKSSHQSRQGAIQKRRMLFLLWSTGTRLSLLLEENLVPSKEHTSKDSRSYGGHNYRTANANGIQPRKRPQLPQRFAK